MPPNVPNRQPHPLRNRASPAGYLSRRRRQRCLWSVSTAINDDDTQRETLSLSQVHHCLIPDSEWPNSNVVPTILSRPIHWILDRVQYLVKGGNIQEMIPSEQKMDGQSLWASSTHSQTSGQRHPASGEWNLREGACRDVGSNQGTVTGVPWVDMVDIARELVEYNPRVALSSRAGRDGWR